MVCRTFHEVSTEVKATEARPDGPFGEGCAVDHWAGIAHLVPAVENQPFGSRARVNRATLDTECRGSTPVSRPYSCSTATGSVYPGFDKWNKSAGAGEHRDDIATISIATSREQDYTLPTTIL